MLEISEIAAGGNVRAYLWMKDEAADGKLTPKLLRETLIRVRDANPRLSYARALSLSLADFRELLEAAGVGGNADGKAALKELLGSLANLGELLKPRDAGAGSTNAAGDGGNEREAEKETVEQRALAVLMKHPDWTKKRIAEAVPCHPKSLAPKRAPLLHKAIQIVKSRNLPDGSKSADGKIEAWEREERG